MGSWAFSLCGKQGPDLPERAETQRARGELREMGSDQGGGESEEREMGDGLREQRLAQMAKAAEMERRQAVSTLGGIRQ